MASTKVIEKHLKIALEEIGDIKPVFKEKFNAWIFKHSAYPDVEYAGDSPEEVIQNYPLYLREFIKQRLDRNISELVEKKTKGRGGKREGAGRPKGTKKEPTERVSMPKDIAKWFKRPGAVLIVRKLMEKKKPNKGLQNMKEIKKSINKRTKMKGQ
jgi:hypothetical protein